jgi:hypothetical protein
MLPVESETSRSVPGPPAKTTIFIAVTSKACFYLPMKYQLFMPFIILYHYIMHKKTPAIFKTAAFVDTRPSNALK